METQTTLMFQTRRSSEEGIRPPGPSNNDLTVLSQIIIWAAPGRLIAKVWEGRNVGFVFAQPWEHIHTSKNDTSSHTHTVKRHLCSPVCKTHLVTSPNKFYNLPAFVVPFHQLGAGSLCPLGNAGSLKIRLRPDAFKI
jgi:hypothetical protein